jgi:hypothetical protein
MIKDKLKSLIPEMEKVIQESKKEKIEKGLAFRTNGIVDIETSCTGTSCRIDIPNIRKKEGTKIGTFHTHPNITAAKSKTTPIGGGFSCSDILEQLDNEYDYACVGTIDEIVCGELKSKPPIDIDYFLSDCASEQRKINEKIRYLANYKDSQTQKQDLEHLDKLQKVADQKLKPYINFEIIKKFVH